MVSPRPPRLRQLICLIGLFLLVPTLYAGPPKGYPFLAFDEGVRKAIISRKKLFIYFGREGCSWCIQTNKEAFSKKKVFQRYTRHYVLVYVDTESGDRLTLTSGERVTEAEYAARMQSFVTPVFIFMEPDGKVLLRVLGLKTAKDLINYDRYVHGGFYKKKTLQKFLGIKE